MIAILQFIITKREMKKEKTNKKQNEKHTYYMLIHLPYTHIYYKKTKTNMK